MVDVIIVGGGPAGMGVALNLLRAGRGVLILECNAFGGQMATSPRLENVPGIKSISGVEYSDQLFEQITDLGAEFELEEVLEIKKNDKTFKVKTNYNEYECNAVVFANGCSHRKMNLPKEEELTGHGISYCAVCDGAFYVGHEACIIGDANTALQYALMLSNYCPKVHIFALFNRLFGDQILIDRIRNDSKFDVTFNVSLQEFIGDSELTGLRFKNTQDNSEFTVNTNNVFIAIGQVPHNQPFKDLIELDKNGFIITNELMETNVPGIFAVGDTRKKDVRQVITALGDASVAAVMVDRYLRNL
ncbi:MAG: FAD-dependent oxidoreductase [Bacilli bacterium]|nr:FAD-dependent oxidoreductase [Bacilli bacterium]